MRKISPNLANLRALGELHLADNPLDEDSVGIVKSIKNLHIVSLPRKRVEKQGLVPLDPIEAKMRPSSRSATPGKKGRRKLPELPKGELSGVAASGYFDRPETVDFEMKRLLRMRAKRSKEIAAGRRVAIRGSPSGLHKKKSRRSLSPVKKA